MTQSVDRLNSALADRYAIERELGVGGMATVYAARDIRHDRSVALKVLKPEIAATLGAERFLLEIRVAAKLNHPHILPLHDSGRVVDVEGGQDILYYSMPNRSECGSTAKASWAWMPFMAWQRELEQRSTTRTNRVSSTATSNLRTSSFIMACR